MFAATNFCACTTVDIFCDKKCFASLSTEMEMYVSERFVAGKLSRRRTLNTVFNYFKRSTETRGHSKDI